MKCYEKALDQPKIENAFRRNLALLDPLQAFVAKKPKDLRMPFLKAEEKIGAADLSIPVLQTFSRKPNVQVLQAQPTEGKNREEKVEGPHKSKLHLLPVEIKKMLIDVWGFIADHLSLAKIRFIKERRFSDDELRKLEELGLRCGIFMHQVISKKLAIQQEYYFRTNENANYSKKIKHHEDRKTDKNSYPSYTQEANLFIRGSASDFYQSLFTQPGSEASLKTSR